MIIPIKVGLNESSEQIVKLGGMVIDPDRLKIGYSGKGSNFYSVKELDLFLKGLELKVSGMNKSQKVKILQEEIIKRYPNIVL